MRIFQVLSAQATGGVRSSQIWLRNLYEPLVDMGHDVFLLRAEEGVQARVRRDASLRAAFSQKLLESFRHEHARKPFDLFFSYLTDGMIEVGVIDEIGRIGVPTYNFSCNNTHQFDLVDEISPHFCYSLHSEKDAAQKFRGVGANPVWFPMSANPKYYHSYDVPRTLDVTFVGQKYGRRPHYIWHLLENGVEVQVNGPGWRLNGKGSYCDQLVGIVEGIAGIKCKRVYDLNAPKGVRGRNSGNTLIKKYLGWEPSTPLRVGMEKTYAWIYDQIISKRAR
jgi:hypothetical protein